MDASTQRGQNLDISGNILLGVSGEGQAFLVREWRLLRNDKAFRDQVPTAVRLFLVVAYRRLKD